jgi:hypothetical protein
MVDIDHVRSCRLLTRKLLSNLLINARVPPNAFDIHIFPETVRLIKTWYKTAEGRYEQRWTKASLQEAFKLIPVHAPERLRKVTEAIYDTYCTNTLCIAEEIAIRTGCSVYKSSASSIVERERHLHQATQFICTIKLCLVTQWIPVQVQEIPKLYQYAGMLQTRFLKRTTVYYNNQT